MVFVHHIEIKMCLECSNRRKTTHGLHHEGALTEFSPSSETIVANSIEWLKKLMAKALHRLENSTYSWVKGYSRLMEKPLQQLQSTCHVINHLNRSCMYQGNTTSRDIYIHIWKNFILFYFFPIISTWPDNKR